MSSRTLTVTAPHMRGDDIKAWQRTLNAQMDDWGIDYRIVADGDYGIVSRDLTASVLYGLGIAVTAMKNGVTPALRIKVRAKKLTTAERKRYHDRSDWRRRLKERHAGGGVARPLAKIITDSWGYHPGVHDGIDLICAPAAPIYAMVDAKVIDVRSGGWWGKAPSGDVTKGDGIIQLEVLRTVGPFKKGMHLGYGHAEGAVVKVGQTVKAGQRIGHAGMAVAWHVHFMVNSGNTSKGIGTQDPRPLVDYAMKHG
jgi:murein DD-endopeptidase MepM/ murein hydrolase activator NlpD